MEHLKRFAFVFICMLVALFNVKASEDTLQQLIDSASDGDTINLSDDYTSGATIDGKKVTVNLNGHTIDVTGDAFIVLEDGELVITGNGNVIATHGPVINKGGVVTILNGNYRSKSWYTIKNMGVMTIENGTFTQGVESENESGIAITGNSSLLVNGWYNGKGTNTNDCGYAHSGDYVSVLTINGGTFNHYTTTSTIKSDDYSKTVINNGTFTSEKGFLTQATGEIVINDGVFNGFKDIATFWADLSEKYEPGILNIKGGEFNSQYLVEAYTTGKLIISDGTFNITSGLTDTSRYDQSYTKEITGGTFKVDVIDDLEETYVTELVNGMYVVKENVVLSNEFGSFESEEAMLNTYELSIEEYSFTEEVENTTNELAESVINNLIDSKSKLDDYKILSAYEINVLENGSVVTIDGDDVYTVTMVVDDNLAKDYKKFFVLCLDTNEKFDATYSNGKITFKTTHLSTYVTVGYNVSANASVNPQTYDGINTTLIMAVLSILAIFVASILMVKRQHN